MKKYIFLMILVFTSTSYVIAQDNNSKPTANLNLVVDSLTTKLNILQHDYDFLYCSHEISLLNLELKAEIDNLDIKSNSILTNCYHSRFDIDLYTAYRENYNVSKELYDSLSGKVDAIKSAVAVKILSSNFSKSEIDILLQGAELLNKCLSKLQHSLDYYKLVIDMYKDLR